jgi:hypothetical protein
MSSMNVTRTAAKAIAGIAGASMLLLACGGDPNEEATTASGSGAVANAPRTAPSPSEPSTASPVPMPPSTNPG